MDVVLSLLILVNRVLLIRIFDDAINNLICFQLIMVSIILDIPQSSGLNLISNCQDAYYYVEYLRINVLAKDLAVNCQSGRRILFTLSFLNYSYSYSYYHDQYFPLAIIIYNFSEVYLNIDQLFSEDNIRISEKKEIIFERLLAAI